METQELLPPCRSRWSREFVVLSREHLEFLDRRANREGVSQQMILRAALDDAIADERRTLRLAPVLRVALHV